MASRSARSCPGSGFQKLRENSISTRWYRTRRDKHAPYQVHRNDSEAVGSDSVGCLEPLELSRRGCESYRPRLSGWGGRGRRRVRNLSCALEEGSNLKAGKMGRSSRSLPRLRPGPVRGSAPSAHLPVRPLFLFFFFRFRFFVCYCFCNGLIWSF